MSHRVDPEGAGVAPTTGEPPIGLSNVHIPSQPHEGYAGGQISGKFRDTDEGRFCHGPSEIPFLHPTGPGVLSDGDRLLSARRWRDGISIGRLPIIEQRGRPTRGSVNEFSESSRGRMVRFLREAEANYKCMGTLTVGAQFSSDPADFRRAVDRWLVAAMRELKRAHRRAGEDPDDASIFWFVEFQSRGAPHLHCFYTRAMPWKYLAEKWGDLCIRFNLCGESEKSYIWKTSTRFEKLRLGFRGMISYARKYAVKSEQKQEVKGVLAGGWRGRFWGVRGNRRRGSCHVQIHSRHSSAIVFRELNQWLDKQVQLGKLGRYYWQYGDGAIYYVKGGKQWSETDMGPRLELFLTRIALATAGDGGDVPRGT